MNAGDRYEYIMCTHTQTYICRIVRSMWLLRRYRELRTSSWRRKKQQQRTRKRWVIHPALHSLAHSPHKMILTFFFIPGKGKKWEVAVGILSIFFLLVRNAHVWFNLASLQCFARQLNYRYDMCIYKNGHKQMHIVARTLSAHQNPCISSMSLGLRQNSTVCACACVSVCFIAIVNLSMLFLIFLCFSA